MSEKGTKAIETSRFAEQYAPHDKYLWDPWFIKSDGTFHMFHLQSSRDGHPDDRHNNKVSIGHAISTDLRTWETVVDALSPGDSGSWDEVSLWTGSVYKKEEKYFMFYTGRKNKEDEFWVQKIGLATSSDLIHWKKDPNNPILQADNNYYDMNNSKNKLGVVPAFRDPFVFEDEKSKKFYMLFSARTHGQKPEYNGCIGIAESDDLSNWNLLPPLLAPSRYDEMEVPQMVIHNEKYYLFFSASRKYTEPKWAQEKGSGSGLHCYVGENLSGEFKPVNSNGVVFDSEEVLGLRLVDKKDLDGSYTALGWLNNDEKTGQFVGRLSGSKTIGIKGEVVRAIS